MKKNRSALKDYFKKGAIPTEANYADLIDSMLNQEEDNLNKLPNDPLRVTAAGTEEALFNFYPPDQSQEKPTWQVKQKPPGGKSGLSIGDETGSRIFIETGSDKIGIGTTTPVAKLDIPQETRAGTHPSAIKGLYVTGAFGSDSDGVEFRLTNGTQGIGFGHNTIYATGSNSDQDLGLKARGTGKVIVNSPLQINGNLNASGYLGGRFFIKDTRADNTPPNQYDTEVAFDFKTRETVGVPGSGTFSGMITLAPWVDDSGDAHHQLNFNNGGIFWRTGMPNAGNWGGEWLQIASNKMPDNFTFMGKLGIGTATPAAKLEVVGTAAVNDGNGFAVKNNFMAGGSLTIGSITQNYGGGSGWTTNTAGLLLETKDNTEIAVHDSGKRVTSLMYYEGESANRITIGRDMGWGTTSLCLGNSDLYFTKTDHDHSGFGNTNGYAAIENSKNYDALMILGRAHTGGIRTVKLWDYLEVNGEFVVNAGNRTLKMQGDGNLVVYSGSKALWATGTNSSDARLKKDIRPIENALEKLLSIKGVGFSWIDDLMGKGPDIGILAQDVETVFPELVSSLDQKYKSVKYIGLIPVLIEAIREMENHMLDLQTQIQTLKGIG